MEEPLRLYSHIEEGLRNEPYNGTWTAARSYVQNELPRTPAVLTTPSVIADREQATVSTSD